MTNEQLTVDDMKGTAALFRAADNITGFTRTVVDDDDRQPCIIYRCKTRPDGGMDFVEVAQAFIGNIEGLSLFEEEGQKSEDWAGLSTAGTGSI